MIVTPLCLVSGYLVTGQWIWVVIAILTSLIWLPARKNPTSWFPSICLFANVCLAVIGLLAGSPPALMICAAGFALATWDSLILDSAIQNNSSGEQTRRYENTHMRSLSLALGFGLLLTFLGRLLELQTPFVMLLLSIGLLMFGLDYVWSSIKKRRRRISVPVEKD
jgi:hypothetical protein